MDVSSQASVAAFLVDMLVNIVYYSRMKLINVFEAKTHLSEILERVVKGEEIIIGKYDQPIAILMPYRIKLKKRKLGGLKGKYRMDQDFDAPLAPELFVDSAE